jgi:hypothetical protein
MRPVRLAWQFLALTITSMPVQAATFGASAAFAHLEPQHVTLECRECHALEPNRADIHKMPGHAACAGCHNFAAEAIDRAEAFCGGCHTSREASQDRPSLYDFPKQHDSHDFGDLFSHIAHKNAGTATRCEAPGAAAQSQCADCHAPIPVPAGQKPDKGMEASHTFCFACHCEAPRGYTAAQKNLNPSRNDCAVCHVAHEAQPTLLTSVPDFRHADHLFDTRPRRKDASPVSHDPDILCVECHRTAALSSHLDQIRQPEAATCNSCHTGKPGLPDPLTAEKPR